MSLRLKLIIIFLAVALIPLFFVSALTFHNYKMSLETTCLSNLQDIALYKADKIETYFNGLKGSIETAQSFYNIKKNLPILAGYANEPNHPEFIAAKQMLDDQLQHIQSVLQLLDIMLVSPDGKIVYSSNPKYSPIDFLNPLSDPQHKAFEEGKKNVYLSDIFPNRNNDNKPTLLITAPAVNTDGVFIGVIVFEVDTTLVFKIVQEVTGLGRTGEVLVGRKIDNQVVFLTPLKFDPQATLQRKVNIGQKIGGPVQEAAQGKTGAGQLIDYRGKKVIAAWRYIPSLKWGMVAKIDTEEAFTEAIKLRNLAIIILAIVTVLTSVTAYSIAQSISEPIKNLAKGAEIIGGGNLNYKIETNLNDEIGQLARSFDKMTRNLKRTLASRDELNKEIAVRKEVEESLRQSETKYRLLVQNANSAIIRWKRDGTLTFFNEYAQKLFGYTPDEVIGKNINLLIPERESTGSDLTGLIQDIVTHPENYANNINENICKNGHRVWMTWTNKPIFDEKGQVAEILAVGSDISKLKQAEEALHQSQEDLNRAQAVGAIGSWRLDIRKNVLTWSDENHRIFGIPKGTPMSYETFLSVVHPDDREYVNTRWKAGLAGEDYDIEHRLLVDGQVKWVLEKAYLEFDENGTLHGGFGITQDITVRKQMEEELKKSRDELEIRVQERTRQLAQTVNILENEIRERVLAEKEAKAERKRFEDVLEMMPAYAVLLTADYKVAYANRTFRKWFGDDNGKHCYEFLFNRTQPCENCETYTVLKTQKSHFWEWTGPNGRNYDIYDYPFTNTDGSPLIMEIGVDVTAHKIAQKAVRLGEERYRSLTVATTQVVWTTDSQGQVVEDLPSWRAFTGQSREEIQGWGWINSLHPDDRDYTAKIWTQSVQNKNFYQTEYRMKRHDGQYRHMSVRGVPVLELDGSIREWIGTCTDITERLLADKKQHVINLLLELFAKKTHRKEYLDAVVQVIRDWSGCYCVGIRRANSDGSIPYESYIGFNQEFMDMENNILLDRDICACTRVIAEKPESHESSAFTARGSFYCANILEFIEDLSEQEKARYRGHCPRCGFTSIAVVPIRYRDKVLGAIHLADKRADQISSQAVEFLENMAMLIGEALYRFDTEMSLRLSQSRLMEAQRIAHLGNWEWDMKTNRLWWSDEVFRIFGIQPGKSEITYDTFMQFVHPQDRKVVERAVKNAVELRRPYAVNHRILREHGIERIVHEQAEIVYDKHDKPIRMIGTVQDVTEQELAEKELRQSQEKLRSLATEIVLTEERERRTIAAALHDSLGPLLAFSKRELGILQKSAPDNLMEPIAYVHEKIKQAVDQTRNLTFDLSPTTLYTLGLDHALEELVEHFACEGGFNGIFHTDGPVEPMTEDIKILIYRSVRELLINIVKHAQAKKVQVTRAIAANDVRVTVEDDGVGFDASEIDWKTGKLKGFGLFNIYERLIQVGGRIDIQSPKTGGTKVMMQLPLTRHKEQ